jgi:hypothetical protein
LARRSNADRASVITPQNFWFFFGGIWLFAGVVFLVSGIAMTLLATPGQGSDVAVDPLIFAGAGVLVTVVGGTLVAKALAKRKLDEELRRQGMPAEATVTDVTPANIRINRMQQRAVHYRYQDAWGQSHTGTHIIAPDEAPQWPPGRRITVRYDAQRPHLHVWIGPAS